MCPLGGPWVWQWPGNAGGLSWACSPWEEMSLNIWLLTRTIYKESGHTGLTGEGARMGLCQVAGKSRSTAGALPGAAFLRAGKGVK